VSLHYTLSVVQDLQMRSEERFSVSNQVSHRNVALWTDIAKWFGADVRTVLEKIRAVSFHKVEEIRLRVGQPLMVRTAETDLFLDRTGGATSPEKAYLVMRKDLVDALERMTQSSLYAAEEDLRQGFLTLPGGNRVGVTGEAVLAGGQIQTLKHVSALNLRIARDIKGNGLKILPLLLGTDGMFRHTLLISPPRAGKTTLLRDLIRLISDGAPQIGLKGQTVGVVDERGELAGMRQGVPTYNLGYRTDVLDGCPKAIGMKMLVRSMAPQVIAMDELGHSADVTALLDALRTGVRILSTAHAASLEEARGRPVLAQLLEQGVFERLVVLSRRDGPGTIDGVYDLQTGRSL
jgi:stage III sporulation protein AA